MRKEYNEILLNWMDDRLTNIDSFKEFVDTLGPGVFYFSGRSVNQMGSIGLPDGNYLIKIYAFRNDRTIVEAVPYTATKPIYYLIKYSSAWGDTWSTRTE